MFLGLATTIGKLFDSNKFVLASQVNVVLIRFLNTPTTREKITDRRQKQDNIMRRQQEEEVHD